MKSPIAPGSLLLAALMVLSVALAGSGPLRAGPDQEAGQPASPPDADASGEGKPAAQTEPSRQAPREVVVVTAPRMEIPLSETPAATSVVTGEVLKGIPRGVGAEEALALVPGIKVDNQANGERVHLSIRGQGLLTERGIRGIKVLLDGLPLNDPTGFAPDLFDVDWTAVERIEVFRGPASALYGGGAAGGVINIVTRDGGPGPHGAGGTFTVGSNDFARAFGEIGGASGRMNYRVSASGNSGDGYRVHTAFDATNLYGKCRWRAGESGNLTAILAGTDYFNQNAEGLNIAQVEEDPRQANPDALTYNEYQKTRRITGGLTGQIPLASGQDVSFSVYYRGTGWRESVPSSVQHRSYRSPGAIAQYSLHPGRGMARNHLTLGTDIDWQWIHDYRNANLGDAVEGARVSDGDISQRGIGVYALDRVEFGPRWSVMLDLRSDQIDNSLDDNLKTGGEDLSGEADFSKTTGRIGVSWNPNPNVGLYASWGQGFLPPATEELANNPAHLGGFNASLEPATSSGEEIGVRGSAGHRFYYDAALFHLSTRDDFGRYRVPSRPLETFYQNAGDTRRYGVETAATWYPADRLVVRASYTYSDFKYTRVNSLFGSFENVWMPNSPRHQGSMDVDYTWRSRLFAGLGIFAVSRAYVDQTNTGHAWGYALYSPRVGYRWNDGKVSTEAMLSARNVFGRSYIAFTEPDPDGNSYQPGPTEEIFLSARISWGD